MIDVLQNILLSSAKTPWASEMRITNGSKTDIANSAKAKQEAVSYQPDFS